MRESIFLFFACGSSKYGHVVSITSREDWIRLAWEKYGLPGADVILVQQGEWDAPTLTSLEPQALQADFPLIQQAIQKKLREHGVPASRLGELTRDVLTSRIPVTGLAVFTILDTEGIRGRTRPRQLSHLPLAGPVLQVGPVLHPEHDRGIRMVLILLDTLSELVSLSSHGIQQTPPR